MYMYVDPDEWIDEIIYDDPQYHGCGGLKYSRRKATPEEYKANKLKRLTAEKEKLESELKRINYELGKLT